MITSNLSESMATFAAVKKVVFILFIVLIAFSCRKRSPGFETEAGLSFSTTVVTFDTVFSGIGSATQLFKVYNRNDKDIKISRVFLEQGSSSNFRFNIDGVSGDQNDVVIAGQDSAFVFVEVTVDMGNQNNPFIIEDELNFITNGITQKVKTNAWGQDAHYYFPNTVVDGLPAFSRITDYKENPAFNDVITWTNDKPHLIYGYLRVDSSITLKIEKGTQIHFHEGAGLWIGSGASLQVEGEFEEEVVFQGDRLEPAYDERAGQWDRIWINEGAESSLKYAIIKNGYVGIQAETTPFDPSATISPEKLILQKTIIRNMVGIGLFTGNFIVEAENCLIYEVGNYDVAINGGGKYNFDHCTFANYWSGNNRQQPTFFASNNYEDLNGTLQKKDLEVNLNNCIIYGNKREEMEVDSLEAKLDILFNHCIIKTEQDTLEKPHRYRNCIINPSNGFNSPVFTNPGNDEFELYSGSTAEDAGDPSIPPQMTEADDLLQKMRDSQPDLGCYEYQK